MQTAQNQVHVRARDGAERVRSLIGAGAVRTVFQPIVDLTRGSVIAYEALTRPSPGAGFDDVGALFRAAGEEGLLWELEEVTRRAAIEAAGEWPDDVKLFLNCTPEVFGDPRFVGAIGAGLRGAAEEGGAGGAGGVRADRLVLEITEQSSDQHVRGLRAQLPRLSEAGIEIAIDDVGVGASGLSRIMALRPRWLKLDREFVEGIHLDKLKQNLVRFFVHFAGLSGVRVVAEGIEEREELATLISLGVRYGQGFYLGRPGARGEALDPSVSRWVRERWAEATEQATESLTATPLARLCRPGMMAQAATPIGEVLDVLGARPELEGVAVFDGRRLAGSCGCAAIEAGARAHGRSAPLRAVTGHPDNALPSEATLAEALRLVVTRPDEDLAAPIVVMDGEQLAGVVTLRDLLRAAAGVKPEDGTAAPLTALPGRAAAERQVDEFVRSGPARGRVGAAAADAAFVDVRRFKDFNGAYGRELGDRLIHDLGELITATVGAGAGVRVWHLGDDRFLLTGPPGVLGRGVRTLMDRFDHECSSLGCEFDTGTNPCERPAAESAEGMSQYPGVSLRVLLMPGAIGRINGIADLYRLEQQLRQRARRQEHLAIPGRSVLVTDTRLDRLTTRLSA